MILPNQLRVPNHCPIGNYSSLELNIPHDKEVYSVAALMLSKNAIINKTVPNYTVRNKVKYKCLIIITFIGRSILAIINT